MILLYYLVAIVGATEITSRVPLVYHDGGSLLSKQVLGIKCTDTTPFSFDVVRENDPSITDHITVECHRPRKVYDYVTVYSYVPMGQVLGVVPIVLAPSGVNATARADAYFQSLSAQQLRNSDTSRTVPSTGRNLLQSNTENDGNDQLDLPTYNGGTVPKLYNWDTILNQELITEAVQGLLTGGLGIIAGGIEAVLTGEGISPLAKVIENIKIIAAAVVDIASGLLAFQGEQILINEKQQAFNYDVIKDLAYTRRRQEIDENSIALLVNNTVLLQDEIRRIVENNDGFRSGLANTISQVFQTDQNIVTYMTQMDARDVNRFKAIYATLQKMVWAVEQNADSIESVRVKKVQQRLAAAYFHRILANVTSVLHALGPALPFMDDIGTPPMAYGDIQNLRNKNRAEVMASVVVQGTYLSNAIYYASEIEFALLCDPTVIANFSLSRVTADMFFRMLGPTGCFDDISQPWFCQCVLRVNNTNIQYPAAETFPNPIFPFEFDNPGVRIANDPQLHKVFPNCVPETVISGECVTGTTSFYSTLTDFETRLQSECESHSWVYQQVRVISTRLGAYHSSISVSPYAFGSGWNCESDYYNLTSSNAPSNNTMAFAIFTYLQREASAFFGQTQQRLDRQLYGVPGQVMFHEYLGSQYPGLNEAYESFDLTFAALTSRETDPTIPRLMPLYLLTSARTEFSMTLTVNEQSPVTVNLSQGVTSMTMNDSQSGNITLVTDSTLNSIPGSELLSETMMWLGTETEYVDDPDTHEAGQPTLFVDFQADTLKYNVNSRRRKGSLNYLELRKGTYPEVYFGEGMPFNRSMWAQVEQDIFEPRDINSPSNYFVRVDPDTGYCGDRIDSRTMQPRAGTFTDNHMCSILHHFIVGDQLVNLNPRTTDSLAFSAREFAFEMEITVPAGALQIDAGTRCPDSVTIQTVSGVAILRATSSAAPTQLRYSICSNVDCLVQGDTMTTPFERVFDVLNREYFFQAWSITSLFPTKDNQCFWQSSGRGIRLLVNYTYSFANTGLADNINQAVLQIVTPAVTQLVNMINILQQVQQAADSGYSSLSQIEGGLNLSLDANLSYILQEPDLAADEQQFADNIAQYEDNAKKVNDIDQKQQGLESQMNTFQEELKNMTDFQRYLYNLTMMELNSLKQRLDEAIVPSKLNLDFLKGLNLNFVKNWIDSIGDLLGLPFGLLGNLKDIFSLIMNFVVLGLVICVCCGCLYAGSKVMHRD